MCLKYVLQYILSINKKVKFQVNFLQDSNYIIQVLLIFITRSSGTLYAQAEPGKWLMCDYKY